MSNSWDQPPQPYGRPLRNEGTAIASLVLGIIGLVGCMIVAPVLAIVFGVQAKNKISQDPALQGAGMAQAGFVLGIVGLVLDVFYLAYFATR